MKLEEQQWECIVLTASNHADLGKLIDGHGREGWELVAVTFQPFSMAHPVTYVAYLKRPRR